MDITSEKYYDDNLEKYNLLNKIDPMTAKQAMEMMENYHQHKLELLGIGGVVGQSEQLLAVAEYIYNHFDDSSSKTAKDYLQDFLSQ
jgi:heptaprenylglyceryl phosphate synthase